jgi:hypothetical protein
MKVIEVMTTIEKLKLIYKSLRVSGFNILIFGGWAEELNGDISPRMHKDIDLLLLSDSFTELDAFMEKAKFVQEIKPKRYTHKRAFMFHGIVVEILLVKCANGKLTTKFWDNYLLIWPPLEIKALTAQNHCMFIANSGVLTFYRDNYSKINSARTEYYRKISV